MRRFVLRLLTSSLVALVVAFVAVLLLTIADLYLVGHGYGSINQETIVWPLAGVRLSPSGVVLLASVAIAWGVAWMRSGRRT